MRNNHIINSFVAGEVSPKFMGRTDAPQYNQSVEKAKNWLIHPQGGASRRPGTIYVCELKREDGTSFTANGESPKVRLIPFVGSDGSTWQLVITSNLADKTVPESPNWQAISTSAERVAPTIEYFGYAFSSGWYDPEDYYQDPGLDVSRVQYAQLGDVVFCVHPNKRPFTIEYDATETVGSRFSLKTFPDVTGFAMGGTTALNLWRQMPFLAPVVGDPSACLKLTTGAGPGLALTLQPGTGSTVTFDANWVGKFIKLTRNSNAAHVILVYQYNSPTSVSCVTIGGTGEGASTVRTYGSSTDLDDFYEEGAWDDVKGWPATVVGFESRIVFGGTDIFPDTMWFSQTNDVYQLDERGIVTDSGYTDPVVATDPFTTTLRSDKLAKIRWMTSSKVITVGTQAREFIVQGPSQAASIGPTNIQSNQETPHGSADAMAAKVENAVVFMQRSRKQLRELSYTEAEDSFKAANLNVLAEHIAAKPLFEGFRDTTEAAFVDLHMQEYPLGVLWCLNSAGSIQGLTRERQQEVLAWHDHEIGGTTQMSSGGPVYANAAYVPKVLTISCVPTEPEDAGVYAANKGEPDQLWMVVSRGVGAHDLVSDVPADTMYTEKMFVEKMAVDWDYPNLFENWQSTAGTPYEAPVYMDCAYITNDVYEDIANAAGIIGPLPHGKGAVVSVLLNGADIGEFTVDANNKIDINAHITGLTSWNAVVGFNFTADLVPVVAEVPAQTGSSQGLPRKIDKLTLHMYRSAAISFGRMTDDTQVQTPIDSVEEVEFDEEDAGTELPTIKLFTGEKRKEFNLGWEDRARVLIRSERPLPVHLTHIIARMSVSE